MSNLRGTLLPILALTLAFVLTPTLASAQQRDFSKVEITTTELGSGLAMLQGAGGNLAVSTGPDGVFLVDDQFAPLTDKIRAAIRAISDRPIRFVLNTHWHGDHTGGNENLGRSGVLILAHRQVRARLSVDQYQAIRDRTIPAAPEAAWPVVTFEDGVTVHLNGQTIEAVHVANAHTDGDALVYFREADVLHTGDTFFNGFYPFIDVSSGGGIDGMIAAADRSLEIAGPRTRIVTGHGPLATREDLESFRAMLVGVRDAVKRLVDEGLDREAAVAERPSRGYDAEYGGGFLKPDDFVSLVYLSLTAE